MDRDPRTRIWPYDRVDTRIAAALVELHPTVLLVFHPVYLRWQLYETTMVSDWTAERLVHAIVGEHRHQGAERWPERFWWHWRGRPRIFQDGLPAEPGPWLLKWLEEADVPIHDYLRQLDAYDVERARANRAARHDLHMAIASDAYRHLRDFQDQDPLAGHRKWQVNVPIAVRSVET